MTQPVVRTLLGEKTLATSLACLPTVGRFSADPVRLVVHEDGTLTEAGRGRLAAALPGAEFVPRAAADAAVLPALARHPRCWSARAGSPLFLKVFDLAVLEPGELRYVDSDVLFVRPFRGIFGPPAGGGDATFMADVKNAYAVRPWDHWPAGRLRLAARVNTGVIRTRAGFLDLDFVEWLLGRMAGRPVWGRRWYWAEQTCWAALAGRGRVGLWDPRLLALATPTMRELAADVAGVHFVSTYRHHLPGFIREVDPAAPPVEVPVRRAGRVGPVRQLVSDLYGRIA